MKRFLRILLNAATVLSLLLGGATVVLWLSGPHIKIRDEPVRIVGQWEYRTAFGFSEQSIMWGKYCHSRMGSIYDCFVPDFRVPSWIVVLATLALPSTRVLIPLKGLRNKVDSGVCSACGYDLRATPERCPECGEPASAASVKTRQ